MTPVNGNFYAIYIAGEGWLHFKYDGSTKTYNSVKIDESWNSSELKIYSYMNDENKSSGQLKLSVSRVEKQKYQIYEMAESKKTIQKNPIDPGAADAFIAYLNSVSKEPRDMALDDPAAMVLFNCIQGVIPFIDTITVLATALGNIGIQSQRVSTNIAQFALAEKIAIQRLIDEIRNSKLMRLLKSPWFGIVMGIVATLLMLAAAIAAIFTAGTTLIVAMIIIIIFSAALIGAAAICVSMAADDDKRRLKELKASLPADIQAALDEAFKEAEGLYTTAQAAILIGIALLVIAAVATGFFMGGSINASSARMAKASGLSAPTKAMKGFSAVEVGSDGLGQMMGLAATIVQAINTIVGAKEKMMMASLEKKLSEQQADAKLWEERSKYFGALYRKFNESIATLMEHLDTMIKAMSSLIKILGEGYSTIARNIAI
ncbi:MAG: hypothetical protein LBS68_00595 [Puniceicoccales bacterium]|nr:hypothetical protein [Puniceicoccales bacterium]